MSNEPNDALRRVPQNIHHVTHHYHNLIYIKNYWESIGQQVPSDFSAELQRAHKHLLEVLQIEKGRGGAIEGE